MSSALKQQILEAIKTSMKAQEKQRLQALRLISAAIKQKEVDERIELDDAQVLTILDKMTKQRRESISQYEKANRQELVDQEVYELTLIQEFLPTALTDDEITQLLESAITSTAATSIRDMGKVMAIIKPQIQGRADMAAVSKQVKDRLA